MEDSLTKVKDKVKSLIHRQSTEPLDSSDSREPGYLSQKPLPATPPHHIGTSRPTVRQVNAFGPEQDESSGGSSTNSSASDKIPSQYLLPEIDLHKLDINDPNVTVHDAQEAYPNKAPSGQVIRSPKRVSDPSQAPAADFGDTDELSRGIKSEPNALSSVIPDRRSSRSFEPDYRVNPPSPEAAVRRKRLSPTAQLPPELNLTNTVDTSIETTQAPAVTHETIHKHTEEITHERITRDIHVDHYYNYVQPIREVIIKPAVHFTIDENGNKIRIPTPHGWEPPPGLEPTPEDRDRGATLAKMIRSAQDSVPDSIPEGDLSR